MSSVQHDFHGDIRAKIARMIRNADENAAFIAVASHNDLVRLNADLDAVLLTMAIIKGLKR